MGLAPVPRSLFNMPSNMLKAVLVDDEEGGRQVLQHLLKDYCPEVEVAAACSNGPEGVQAILKHQPDLVFMDIDMPDMSGFDVLECVKNLQPKVIFVTAHNQHAIRAFRYSAVDYLLKPVHPSALTEAVQKASQVEFKRGDSAQYELLAQQLQHREQLPEIIALPMADGLELTRIDDILYCKADRNYTHIFRLGKTKLLVTRQLKEFETMLVPHCFFRVHNSTLVNLKYVRKYIRTDGGYVEMEDGTALEISRMRKEEFLSLLQKV